MKNLLSFLLALLIIGGVGYLAIQLSDSADSEPESRPSEEMPPLERSTRFLDSWIPTVYGPLERQLPAAFSHTLQELLVELEAEWEAAAPQERPNIEAVGQALRHLENGANHYSQAWEAYARKAAEPLPGIRSNAAPAAVEDAKENREYFLNSKRQQWLRQAEDLRREMEVSRAQIKFFPLEEEDVSQQ